MGILEAEAEAVDGHGQSRGEADTEHRPGSELVIEVWGLHFAAAHWGGTAALTPQRQGQDSGWHSPSRRGISGVPSKHRIPVHAAA